MTEPVTDIISNSSVFVKETTTPRAVVGATCVLSMIGSAMIIVTYIAFKQLRNPTRHILVHLSLMDFGVALANFIGCVVYFDRYYYDHFKRYNDYNVPSLISYSCTLQAAVAVTCNNSSVFWTVAVAVYLNFKIVTHSGYGKEKFLIIILAVVSYGIPVLLTIWLGWTNRLGFAPYDSSGWCTLIVLSPNKSKDDVFAGMFGNDFWIYLAFFLIPLLYFSIKVHTKRQVCQISKCCCRTIMNFICTQQLSCNLLHSC